MVAWKCRPCAAPAPSLPSVGTHPILCCVPLPAILLLPLCFQLSRPSPLSTAIHLVRGNPVVFSSIPLPLLQRAFCFEHAIYQPANVQRLFAASLDDGRTAFSAEDMVHWQAVAVSGLGLVAAGSAAPCCAGSC